MRLSCLSRNPTFVISSTSYCVGLFDNLTFILTRDFTLQVNVSDNEIIACLINYYMSLKQWNKKTFLWARVHLSRQKVKKKKKKKKIQNKTKKKQNGKLVPPQALRDNRLQRQPVT